MRHLWADIRYGARMLVRYPTLSLASIVTFGLGIGITTTVFSVVNGAFFKGLPFERADRIVAVTGTNVERNAVRQPITVHDLVVFEERQTAFEALGAVSTQPINLAWDGSQAERYSAGALTVGAFRALRVEPVLGRTFREGEDRPGADPVILLGYDVWRDRFGGSPAVLGKSVRANGVARTIIGVMPPRFAFPNLERLWVPLQLDPLATSRGKGPAYRVVGRLRDGVSMADARAQMGTIAAGLEKEYPDSNRGLGATVMPYTESAIGPQLYAFLYTMLGAGIGVLLIACVNVSNLLLARASLREREVAVRLALGAGRGRVLRQILTEVLVLAAAGAALGMAFSAVAMRWFVAAVQSDPPPFWITFELDGRVLLFVTAATLVASVFAGALPALQATRLNVASTLKDDSRGASGFRVGRFGGMLVVAEMTVSCALLIAAGLMAKSIAQVRTVDLPFAVDPVLTARINLPLQQYPDPASRVRFYDLLLPQVRAIPGVEAATMSDGLPAAGNGALAIQVEGRTYARDTDYPVVREGIVTPGYFETFQTPILRGREFTSADVPGREMVAIVNESFARAHFAGDDPIGRHIRKGGAGSIQPWLTIVGIVPDLLMQGFGNAGQSPVGYYIPIAQSDVAGFVNIAVRTRGEPGDVTSALRASVAALDADLAIYDVRPMRDVIDQQTFFYSVFGSFFMAFGCAGLLLAAAGLYGVMSFAVTTRTRELGIRAALGAQSRQLVLLVMRKAVIQSVVGLALGLVLGLLATGPLAPVLYEVSPRDPFVFATVVTVLAATGLITGLVAAKRITRLDPVVALAAE